MNLDVEICKQVVILRLSWRIYVLRVYFYYSCKMDFWQNIRYIQLMMEYIDL